MKVIVPEGGRGGGGERCLCFCLVVEGQGGGRRGLDKARTRHHFCMGETGVLWFGVGLEVEE